MEELASINNYSYYSKGVPGHFQKILDEFVEELQRKFGRNFEISINALREEPNREYFKISLLIRGLGEPVFIVKKGANLFHVLKKIKKSSYRKLKRELRATYSMKELRLLKKYPKPVSV